MCLNVYNSLYYSSCWKYILVARLCFLSARVHHIAQHFWGVNVSCFDWIKFRGHWAFSHALCLQSTKDSQEKKSFILPTYKFHKPRNVRPYTFSFLFFSFLQVSQPWRWRAPPCRPGGETAVDPTRSSTVRSTSSLRRLRENSGSTREHVALTSHSP